MKGVPKKGAAKTFAQIGAELGVTPQGAAHIFYRALRKLREERPNAVTYLNSLANELSAERCAAERAY